MNSIRVGICDSSPVLLYGLKYILDSDPKIKVVIQTTSQQEILNHYAVQNIDILLVEHEENESPGLDYLRKFKDLRPDVKILVFSACSNTQTIMQALNLGIQGFQLKQAEPREILDTIHTIYNGGTSMAARITAALIGHVSSNQPAKPAKLSKRETEVLELIANGKTNGDIASKLYISIRTVKFHISSIFHKLKVKNRTQAAALWMH